MKCLFCDKSIDKISIASLFLEEDKLCLDCRKQLRINKKYIYIDDLKVETFYDYDSLFKSILLQYKECYDEALSEVFLYLLNDYIKVKYHGYKILFVPSSKYKLDCRGFNHLELIFKNINLEKVSGLEIVEDIVQEGKSFDSRKAIIDNYLYVGGALDKVLIVDDVLTTGSSMKGVYKAIKPYSKKVKGLSLSYVRKRFHFE